MYNPITISKFFIQNYGERNDITPMKLVKLVYISHGWYLGLTGQTLIDENSEAWQYGPVIPSVYHYYKGFGRSPIKNLSYIDKYNEELPEEIQNFLHKIWDVYGKYSGIDLSSLTHEVGTPWFKIWQKTLEAQQNTPGGLSIVSKQIPDNLIRDHYRSKMTPQQRESIA